LGAFAGTSILGGYVVASKFAELLRLLPLAYTYVLYPAYASAANRTDPAEVRRTMTRAGVTTALATIPVALSARVFIPLLYGSAFHGAIVLVYILLVGLAAEGMAGVVSAYLYGIGRPGLNSLAIGAGVVVTVALDIVLIPRFGAVGAAVASSAAYLMSTSALLVCFRVVAKPPLPAATLRPHMRGDAA
jgi:O-antigen/teichoic acid export membrane protein